MGLFEIGWGLGDPGFFVWEKYYNSIICVC